MNRPHDDHPIPAGQRVDVWLLPLAGDEAAESVLRCASSLLPQTETQVAQAIESRRERVLYVGSRVLLRVALSRSTGVPPAAWVFGSHAGGKPCIVTPERHRNIEFNISHAHQLAACAISAAPVGVDIEFIAAGRDVSGIARRFFAPQEIEALDAAEPGHAHAMFHRLWTLKEAYLKGKGSGFPEELPSCRFELFPEPRLASDAVAHDGRGTWRFHSRSLLDQTYFLAVALCAGGPAGIDTRLRWIDAATDLPRPPALAPRREPARPGC
jgi:4'-phosphopantetheinyl transferase